MRQLFLILTAYLSLTTATTSAQTDTANRTSKYHFWINGGGQPCFADNFHSLIGGQLGLNLSINDRHFLKLKGYQAISTNLLTGSLFTDIKPNQLNSLKNVSLLYGIGKYFSESIAIIASTGISYGSAEYRGQYLYTQKDLLGGEYAVYDDYNYNYIGLPLDISFVLTSHVIGGSIDLYANIHKHPDYGISINLLLGKIIAK